MPGETVPDAAVWDTCVLISAIQQTQDKHADRWAQIAPFLADAERGEFRIVLSELVRAELLNLQDMGSSGMTVQEQRKLIKRFLEHSYIVWRPVNRAITIEAGRIRQRHKITTPDAIMLATAVYWDIPLVHTYDGQGRRPGTMMRLHNRLKTRDGKKIAIEVPRPYAGTLFNGGQEESGRGTGDAGAEAGAP